MNPLQEPSLHDVEPVTVDMEEQLEEKMNQVQLGVEEKIKEVQQKFETRIDMSNLLLAQVLGSLSQIRSESIALTYDLKRDVEGMDQQVANESKPQVVSHGSKVLYKKFAIDDHDSEAQLGHLSSQIMRSMELAYRIDKDCTVQFGSIAIMKYTDAGPRSWILHEDSTPTIISYRRSPWTLSDLLAGRPAIWTIKGFNLQKATLRASTADKSENLEILYQYQTRSGVDVLVCKEPCLVRKSAPMFQEQIHIIASKSVELEGVAFKVQSQAKNVKEAYWKAVGDGLVPHLWTIIFITIIVGIHFFLSKFWNRCYLDVLRGQASTNVGINLEGNSVLSNIWSEHYLHKMFLFYVLAIVIPDFVSRLWLHLQESFPQLGAAIVVLASTMIVVREKGRKILPGPRFMMPPPGTEKLNDSIWKLYSPNAIPEMDIIFFHGLQLGDLEDAFWKTWLGWEDHEKVVWPQRWLSEIFPRARILSVSYDSSALAFDGEHNAYTLGENLVSDIVLDSKCNIGQNRPVFLVGHSLGGIVIKEFILSAIRKKTLLNSGDYDDKIERLNTFLDDSEEGVLKEIVLSAAIERKNSFNSRNRERYRRDVDRISTFLRNCKGVFFYATPHLGSRIAELARLVPHTSPRLELLKTLHNHSARINEEFRQQRPHLNIRTFGMAEGRKTNYGAFDDSVVEEESAQYEMDEFHTETTRDHFSVCTAESRNDPVVATLVRFIANLFPQVTSNEFYVRHRRRQSQQPESRGFCAPHTADIWGEK